MTQATERITMRLNGLVNSDLKKFKFRERKKNPVQQKIETTKKEIEEREKRNKKRSKNGLEKCSKKK
jgi:hypothetical protein